MSNHANTNLVRKKWTSRHVLMCHLKGTGLWTNKAIAEYFGCSEVTVSQVLNTEQGKAELAAIQKNLRAGMADSINGRLLKLMDKGVERLAQTIDAEFLPGSDPKKHQDNVALQLLKGKGHLSGVADDGDGNNSAPTALDRPLAQRLIAALEKSNEAERIYNSSQGEIIEAVVVPESDPAPVIEVEPIKRSKTA